MFWKNKGGVRKIYNNKKKYWDYEIINNPNWKPDKTEILTKNKILDLSYKDFFDNILSIDQIETLKEKSKTEYNNYNNVDNFSSIKTKFKLYLSYKKYIYYNVLENIIYDIISNLKTDKNVYFYNGNYNNLIKKYPAIHRIKSTGEIHISDNIKKVISNDIGVFYYWEFKDGVIFVN